MKKPTMITDLFIVFTGFLGFITLFIILFGYKSNRFINIYLALIILLTSFRLILIGIKDLTKSTYLEEFIHQNNIYFILLTPFFYLYFKNLILSQKNFIFKDLFHLTIPILFILESRFSIIQYLFNVKINFAILYVFIPYAITYNFLTYLELKKNIWHKKGSLEIVIKQNSLIRKWSIYLYVALNLIVVRLLVSLFLETKTDGFISGQYGIWITSIVWILIYIKILTTPEILYGYSFLQNKREANKNHGNNKISQWIIDSKATITNIQDLQLSEKIKQNIESHIADIDKIMESNNFFRNPKFTLTDLALKLNIPKSHLSYLFKYHSKISFSDYKKIARIQDALKLIEVDYLKTNTFDSLAKEVGFASYNPFFTSFKDIVGKSPQEYCSAQESKS